MAGVVAAKLSNPEPGEMLDGAVPPELTEKAVFEYEVTKEAFSAFTVAQPDVQLDVQSTKYLPDANTVEPSIQFCEVTVFAAGAKDVPAAE